MMSADPAVSAARDLFDKALEELGELPLAENRHFESVEDESTANYQVFELVKEGAAPIRFTFTDGFQVAVGPVGEVVDIAASTLGDPERGVVATALDFLTSAVKVAFTHRDKRVSVELVGADGTVQLSSEHRSLWGGYAVDPEHRVADYPRAFPKEGDDG